MPNKTTKSAKTQAAEGKKTRKKTPSLVCELPLKTTPADERQLLIRLNCGRLVYNACLGEGLKRLQQLRESKAWREARQLPRGPRGSDAAKRRNEAFDAAEAAVGFSDEALQAYSKNMSHSWIGHHLDSNTVQKTATRAWRALHDYYVGAKGKPRFKGKGQFDSLEGKSNASGIRWRNRAVEWNGLVLRARVADGDPVIEYGLRQPIKFARIVRRKLGRRVRFYVQLVCEGYPLQQVTRGEETTGVDIGPSNIAVVNTKQATLKPFCAELERCQADIRDLQRKLDRQRRANNPDNFNADGTIKQGKKVWHDSERYQATRDKLADLQRRQAAYRKSLHGHETNQLIARSRVIKAEKVSYRAFQRRFGKSVGFRAPGMFVAMLRRKAANAGVEFDEFPTVTTRLSQTCICGAVKKKTLSERWHVCACGVGPIQRDLFSAWLARYVVNDRLDADQVHQAWPGADVLLRAASSEIQAAMGQGQPKPNPGPAQADRGQSRSPAKLGPAAGKARQGARPALARKPVAPPTPVCGISAVDHLAPASASRPYVLPTGTPTL